MTEYDYSPEALERYLAMQAHTANWVQRTQQHELANPFIPIPGEHAPSETYKPAHQTHHPTPKYPRPFQQPQPRFYMSPQSAIFSPYFLSKRHHHSAKHHLSSSHRASGRSSLRPIPQTATAALPMSTGLSYAPTPQRSVSTPPSMTVVNPNWTSIPLPMKSQRSASEPPSMTVVNPNRMRIPLPMTSQQSYFDYPAQQKQLYQPMLSPPATQMMDYPSYPSIYDISPPVMAPTYLQSSSHSHSHPRSHSWLSSSRHSSRSTDWHAYQLQMNDAVQSPRPVLVPYGQVYQPSSTRPAVILNNKGAGGYIFPYFGQNVQTMTPHRSYAYSDYKDYDSDSDPDSDHGTSSSGGLSLKGLGSSLRSRKLNRETIVAATPQHNTLHGEINKDVDIRGAAALSELPDQGIDTDTISDKAEGNKSEHFQTTACWIAAEHALQHARSNISIVSEVFDRWNIQKSEYAVLAGFDEFLIKSGVGYLEQIHVFVSAKVDPTSPLLSELGRLFSPFSSILFTESSSYPLPVFKDDGNVWEFDELSYFTASTFADGGFRGKTPLTVISLSQTPSLADSDGQTGLSQSSSGSGKEEKNGKRRSEKGKERDRGDEDEADKGDKTNKYPHDDSEDPSGETVAEPRKISFAIVSEIYPIQDKQNAFQTLTSQGSLTIKTTPAAQSLDPFSTRCVQFTELTFGTERTMETGYRQFHVRVIINSQHKNAGVMGIIPKRTPESEREEKQSSATKTSQTRGLTVGMTVGPHPHGAITGAVTKTNEENTGFEKKRYTSRITEQHNYGVVRWGFNVDDLHEQERGIDMSGDILPTVCFEFVGNPKVPPPPPERMDIEIASYWSMIPRNEPKINWIRTILNLSGPSGNHQAESYSNLCQLIALETAPSNLPPRSDYRATMHVSPGVPDPHYISYYTEVDLSTAESVTVTPAFTTDDWQKPNTLKLPMLTNLKLSECCRQNLEKPDRDTKSQ